MSVAPPTPPSFPLETDSPEDFDDKAYDCFPYVAAAATNVYANAQAAETAATNAANSEIASGNSANTATTKAAEAAASAASALSSPGTSATSTSTITPAMGPISFTLVQTGKDFVVGQFVTVSNSPTNFFNGQITAFNSDTGAITVNGRTVESTGSASSWTITASAPAQGEKFNAPCQSAVALGNVSGTVNVDLRNGLDVSMTLVGNTTLTFTMPDLFASGTSTEVTLLITKSGSYSLTMPVGTEYSDGAAPNPSSGTKNEYVGTRRFGGNWIFALSRKNIS